jgi:predicted nucleic acid-binding protein
MNSIDGLALSRGALVLVDSSALIYLLSETERADIVRAFFDAAESGTIKLAASTLAWTEVLAGPLAAGDEAAEREARRLLSDSSRLYLAPLDVAVAEEASRLMAAPRQTAASRMAAASRHRLETADAVHLATALTLGAEAVLTNDSGWREFLGANEDGAMEDEVAEKGARRRHPAARGPKVFLLDELVFDEEGRLRTLRTPHRSPRPKSGSR